MTRSELEARVVALYRRVRPSAAIANSNGSPSGQALVGTILDWRAPYLEDAVEGLVLLDAALSLLAQADPPRGACGMRNHHPSCTCQGEGGDR
jgi:hypothetical protein